jgi:hypothetical protein
MGLVDATLAHAIALAFRGEHGGVMGQPVEQRRGQLLIAGEHGDPLSKCEIRRDDGRPALVPIREQIKEQLATDAVEGHKPELVDDEDVHAEEPLLEPSQLAGITRFNQLTYQIGGPGEEYAPFLFRR